MRQHLHYLLLVAAAGLIYFGIESRPMARNAEGPLAYLGFLAAFVWAVITFSKRGT